MPASENCRFRRSKFDPAHPAAGAARPQELGITMVLVAVAMVAIIAMAALSIDVVTLYLAREDAQRSADTAALAAARVISVSGITGTADPNTDASSWTAICGASGTATLTAQAVGIQNGVGGAAPDSVDVKYSAGGGAQTSDCSSLPKVFAVNPIVTVQVTRASLPTFFSRIWGNRGNSVRATATAEVFNPSYSGGNGGTIIPVQPHCVKPWVVPNRNPLQPPVNGGGKYCDQAGGPGKCDPLVDLSDASIHHAGISLGGVGTGGVIGEQFWLVADCAYSGSSCVPLDNPAQANHSLTAQITAPPNLDYLPGLVGTPASAVSASCTGATAYEQAIAGCDLSTNYQCGVGGRNTVDLMENPSHSGSATSDTSNAVQCLIGEGDPTDTQPDGQDTLDSSAFPFKILAGTSTPLTGLAGNPITSSNSIVSLPIYDENTTLNGSGKTSVTFVGFLQVFINAVDQYGNVNVTVLNVAGCSNDADGSPALGSSPVPVRLITPP